MLILIAKDAEKANAGYKLVIYVDNIRKEGIVLSLVKAYQEYPKAHLTSMDKLQAVDAAYKLTENTEELKEFWETL